MIKKYGLPLLVYLIVFIGFGFIFTKTIHDGFGVVITSLLLANCVTVFLVSVAMTYRYGFDIMHMLLMALTFVISVYVVFNDSALFYLVPYVIIDLIGFGVGSLLRHSKR